VPEGLGSKHDSVTDPAHSGTAERRPERRCALQREPSPARRSFLSFLFPRRRGTYQVWTRGRSWRAEAGRAASSNTAKAKSCPSTPRQHAVFISLPRDTGGRVARERLEQERGRDQNRVGSLAHPLNSSAPTAGHARTFLKRFYRTVVSPRAETRGFHWRDEVERLAPRLRVGVRLRMERGKSGGPTFRVRGLKLWKTDIEKQGIPSAIGTSAPQGSERRPVRPASDRFLREHLGFREVDIFACVVAVSVVELAAALGRRQVMSSIFGSDPGGRLGLFNGTEALVGAAGFITIGRARAHQASRSKPGYHCLGLSTRPGVASRGDVMGLDLSNGARGSRVCAAGYGSCYRDLRVRAPLRSLGDGLLFLPHRELADHLEPARDGSSPS